MKSPETEPKGRPAPLVGAVLALVVERSGYGYELAQRLQERLGPSWRFGSPSVYPLLEHLERKGLVQRREREQPGQGRERVMYDATPAGKRWRRAWLAGPVRRESTRSELLAKMVSAQPGDAPLILAALDEYERDIIQLLEEYGGEERPAVSGFSGLMLGLVDDDICTLLGADRDWVVRARRRIMEYLDQQGG